MKCVGDKNKSGTALEIGVGRLEIEHVPSQQKEWQARISVSLHQVEAGMTGRVRYYGKIPKKIQDFSKF
jgi:hypothetical protein